MRHRTKEGGATVPVAQLQSFARQRATMGGSILCLARALLAAPFGPLAMCFLRTSQCFGWHDPLFSRSAASQESIAVTTPQAQGEVGH